MSTMDFTAANVKAIADRNADKKVPVHIRDQVMREASLGHHSLHLNEMLSRENVRALEDAGFSVQKEQITSWPDVVGHTISW